MGLSADELAEFVRRSCERQGVPEFVTDAAVVAGVVVLLGGGSGGGEAKPAPARAASSEPPDGFDSVGVEGLGAGGAGSDDGMVQDGGDDGGLSGEVEFGPSAA